MNINCLFGDSRLTIFIIVLSVMSGCASAPKLTQIPNGETVSIVVAASPIADGQTELRNDAKSGGKCSVLVGHHIRQIIEAGIV